MHPHGSPPGWFRPAAYSRRTTRWNGEPPTPWPARAVTPFGMQPRAGVPTEGSPRSRPSGGSPPPSSQSRATRGTGSRTRPGLPGQALGRPAAGEPRARVERGGGGVALTSAGGCSGPSRSSPSSRAHRTSRRGHREDRLPPRPHLGLDPPAASEASKTLHYGMLFLLKPLDLRDAPGESAGRRATAGDFVGVASVPSSKSRCEGSPSSCSPPKAWPRRASAHRASLRARTSGPARPAATRRPATPTSADEPYYVPGLLP